MAKKTGFSFLDDPEEKGKKEEASRRILSAEEKLAILREIGRGGRMADVASMHGLHAYTPSRWLKRLREEGAKTEEEALEALKPNPPIRKTPVAGIDEDVKEKILDLKREHFEMGPAQIQAQLRRFCGIKVSIKPIRRVLKEAGYQLEARSKGNSVKPCTRFEMSRPNELWISDIFEFRIHKEKGYLVSYMDDFSRMILGWRAGRSCTGETVVELLDETIGRHGKPERVLTDRGPQYASFEGMTVFQKHLEELAIDHSMARSYHPQTCGKLEAFHRSLKRELLEVREFASLEEAEEGIRDYIGYFNTRRAHMGIGGLAPADRYFGRQDEVLEEMARGCAEKKSSSPESLGDSGAIEVLGLILQDNKLVLRFGEKEFQIG